MTPQQATQLTIELGRLRAYADELRDLRETALKRRDKMTNLNDFLDMTECLESLREEHAKARIRTEELNRRLNDHYGY